MSYSILFLTATCLAGGSGDGPAAPAPAHQSPAPAISHGAKTSCDCAASKNCERCGLFAGLFARLRTLFHRDCCDCSDCCKLTLRERLHKLFSHRCCPEPCCTASPPILKPEVLPKPMPSGKELEIKRTSTSSEIDKEYLDRVRNAADYSWVTGQLYYIHADKGLWVVRYAPVDREDRYGGSVVLAAATSMDSFQEGDLVTVQGEMLNEGRASKYLGGPLYRALGVSLVDRRK